MIVGDLNFIFNQCEKRGGIWDAQLCSNTNQIFQNAGLLSIPYSGYDYTWWNRLVRCIARSRAGASVLVVVVVDAAYHSACVDFA